MARSLFLGAVRWPVSFVAEVPDVVLQSWGATNYLTGGEDWPIVFSGLSAVQGVAVLTTATFLSQSVSGTRPCN